MPRLASLAGTAALLLSLQAGATDDRLEYRLHCSGCHGTDGHGLPPNGIPDLHDAGRWAGFAAGREYLVQVPGISASGIDNELAARMLNWTLKTYSADRLPPDFKPFTADEVQRYRTQVATDANKRRHALAAELKVSSQSPRNR